LAFEKSCFPGALNAQEDVSPPVFFLYNPQMVYISIAIVKYLLIIFALMACKGKGPTQQANNPQNSIALMDSSIRVIREIDIYDECNYKKADLLVELKTHNKDSLLRATQTLAGILQKQIEFDSTCARTDKTVELFLYDKMDGYKDSHFYIRGSVTGSESPKAEFRAL